MMDPCCSSPGLTGVDEALAALLAAAHPLTTTEDIPLGAARQRVLAMPCHAAIDVPGYDNSAMDGYAVRCGDIDGDETALPVVQRIPAGTVGAPLAPRSAARIFTGAPVPEGADAVVMQERCRADDGRVIVMGAVRPGQNIRRRGEDLMHGTEIVPVGARLTASALGLIASVGIGHVHVFSRLRVATFSTGDELAEPGHPLPAGSIYNSNRPLLTALIEASGFEVIDLGRVADNLAATRSALDEAAAISDVIVTTGGVSVGEEDHVRAAVEALGRLDLWRIAIKPGKPLAFGQVGTTPFIGLPGNPVSAFVTFCVFVRPFLLRRAGATNIEAATLPAHAGFDWPKPDKRREYLRARLDADGVATIHPHQGSGVLSSVHWADGFVVVPGGQPVRRGDVVRYLPFAGLLV